MPPERRSAVTSMVGSGTFLLGAAFDLSKNFVRAIFLANVKKGAVLGAMLAPPCGTFSIAQRGKYVRLLIRGACLAFLHTMRQRLRPDIVFLSVPSPLLEPWPPLERPGF